MGIVVSGLLLFLFAKWLKGYDVEVAEGYNEDNLVF